MERNRGAVGGIGRGGPVQPEVANEQQPRPGFQVRGTGAGNDSRQRRDGDRGNWRRDRAQQGRDEEKPQHDRMGQRRRDHSGQRKRDERQPPHGFGKRENTGPEDFGGGKPRGGFQGSRRFEEATHDRNVDQGLTLARPPGNCYACGEPGHIIKNCPKNGQNPNEGQHMWQNFRGPKDGLRHYDTPSPTDDRNDAHVPKQPRCFHCGQEGHKKYDCPERNENRTTSTLEGSHTQGHVNTQQPSGGFGLERPSDDARLYSPFGGFVQQQLPYFAWTQQNIQAAAATSHAPRKPITCYNCNQEGHVSRNCRAKNSENAGGIPPVSVNMQPVAMHGQDLPWAAPPIRYPNITIDVSRMPPSMNDVTQFPTLQESALAIQRAATSVDYRDPTYAHCPPTSHCILQTPQQPGTIIGDQEVTLPQTFGAGAEEHRGRQEKIEYVGRRTSGQEKAGFEENRDQRGKNDFVRRDDRRERVEDGGQHGQRDRNDFHNRRDHRDKADDYGRGDRREKPRFGDKRENRDQCKQGGIEERKANNRQREKVDRRDKTARRGSTNEDAKKDIAAQEIVQVQPKAILGDAQVDGSFAMGFEPNNDVAANALATQTESVQVQVRKRVTEIEHDVLLVDQLAKADRLEQLILREGEEFKHQNDQCKCEFFEVCKCKKKMAVIVTKYVTVQSIKIRLGLAGVNVAVIYSGMHDWDRQRALNRFKTGRELIMVLMDSEVMNAASCFGDIAWLVNFNMPLTGDEYDARMKLASRQGKELKITSFYDNLTDFVLAGKLVQILKDNGQDVPEWLEEGSTDDQGDDDEKVENEDM